MEDAYIINGGNKLKGTVALSGAKNIALKAMIAALMFQGKVILENVPMINDVLVLMHLMMELGAKVSLIGNNQIVIDASTIDKNRVDILHASKIRVSFMLFAPLLHRFQKCYVPNPGGCRIGARPIDRIINGMIYLGVKLGYDSSTGYYEAEMSEEGLKGEYIFDKSTHTGTELLIMLSAIGKNKIVLNNSALEPEIDELILFLNEAGANIQRVERQIIIKGVPKLVQKKPFFITFDRNEAVTFAILGIATKGEVIIENIAESLIEHFLETLRITGSGVEFLGKGKVRFYSQGDIRPVSIETSAYPGFMTDWQPNWAILMTQAKGESTIHERVFENRFSYVSELKKLGAKIEFVSLKVSNPGIYYNFDYDPKRTYQQAIKITGPSVLHDGVLAIHDLRAGASLVIASLIARGESIIQGASIVERGYENFEDKVKSIGGDIKKL